MRTFEDLNKLTKVELAQICWQALTNCSTPLPADHFLVEAMAKKSSKNKLIYNAKIALKILLEEHIKSMPETKIKEVYFHPTSVTFSDNTRKELTLEEARAIWESAQKDGADIECNLAFSRLVWHKFDVDAALADYQ
jgi:hypothetical protein